MSTFIEDFQTDDPDGQSIASDIDVFINAQTKQAINERLNLEHFDLEDAGNDTTDEDAQGRHKAGYVGAWGKGTAAEMRLVLTAGIGSFWEITTVDAGETEAPVGTMFRFEVGTGWTNSSFGQGAQYATPAEIETDPPADKAISALTLRQADTEFVALTTPITSIGTVTIATDLDQAGVDVTNIRALHVYFRLTAVIAVASNMSATYPDGTANGTSREIARVVLTGTATYVESGFDRVIPVNRITETVTFAEVGGVPLGFEVYGVTQRTYAEVV
jgi:hypothetical protein